MLIILNAEFSILNSYDASQFTVFQVFLFLLPHHPGCFLVLFVVIPEQVKDSMDKQPFHLDWNSMFQFQRLPLRRFPGNNHIPQQLGRFHWTLTFHLREGKNVRWTIHGTVDTI